MTEEKKPQENKQAETAPKTEAEVKPAMNAVKMPAGAERKNFGRRDAAGGLGDRKRNFKGGRKGGPRGRADNGLAEEFEQKMLDIARVTRVMAGGKRMRFRACVAVGNKKGRVGIGLAKGADVTAAVTKAVNKAKKEFIDVPIYNETIPHEVYKKAGAAKILLKPARKGRGIIAGGVVRIILELSGAKNVIAKILGTGNKVNNAKCAIEALKSLKRIEVKKAKTENKPVLSTVSDLTKQDKK